MGEGKDSRSQKINSQHCLFVVHETEKGEN